MSSDRSPPRSSGSTLTNEEGLADFKPNGLHLDLAPFRLEHIFGYGAGGYHPVHLDDVYGDNARYRVMHKLGHDDVSTLWLSRDLEAEGATKYVTLKILMAGTSGDRWPKLRTPQGDEADFFCLPLDNFIIHGPNGNHVCLVYAVLGPSVSLGLFTASTASDRDLRSISLQVVNAVKFLHSDGICHGDITPNHFLHRVSGLDGLSEHEVLQVLGKPVVNPILNSSSKKPHDQITAPRYLVYPLKWCDVNNLFKSTEPCFIDFGEAFEFSQPPDSLGTPWPYRSPELLLDDQKAGFGSDLWALGCTLFEIRTGRKLFEPCGDEDSDYLDAMVQVLGKLPEPWWSETWKDRRRLYNDDVDEQGHVVDTVEHEPVKDDTEEKQIAYTSTIHPSVAQGARSLQEKIAPGVWYMDDDYPPNQDRHRDISKTEQELFADLLGRLLKYKPEERISADEAMNHDWFKL